MNSLPMSHKKDARLIWVYYSNVTIKKGLNVKHSLSLERTNFFMRLP